MILDFTGMEETVIPHMRGGDKEVHTRMRTDELGKIMRGRLIPGASIGLHTHETGSEVIYILSGTGKFLYDGAWEPFGPGVCHYCPKGHSHSFVNDGAEDVEFFAVIPEQ
ncbi:MAG: cupin domain-containing protein [Pseudoflavonifractor sp.]|nr:cupin domain-containing protein [Pseudoflavonifractor sp.]